MSLIAALNEIDKATPRMREVVLAIRDDGGWRGAGWVLKKFNWLAEDDHEAAQLLWRHLGQKHGFRMRRAPKSKQKNRFSGGNGQAGGRGAE
jgi:uncharacterized membrane protein YgcG